MLITPMRNRNEPEIEAPMMPPTSENVSMLENVVNEMPTAMRIDTTTVECPMLKNTPTVVGRRNP